MGSISTFGMFTQSKLAIYASQAGISVTGNNIANINTEGYTRQKLDQTSFYAGGADRYYSKYSLNIGYGVLATGTSQLRDPYLDIRYREAAANVGAHDAKLGGLETIQSIIDEVGDGKDGNGVISASLGELLEQLELLVDQTGQDSYDFAVRSAAESLCQLLNSYSAQLDEAFTNAEKALEKDIDKVNATLESISALNKEIMKAEIRGDGALELKDERNVLIDELANYMNIDVIEEEITVGAGVKVDKLTIRLANDDADLLIDNDYYTQLSIWEDAAHTKFAKNYAVTLAGLVNAQGDVLSSTKTSTPQSVGVDATNNNQPLVNAGVTLTDNGDGTYSAVTTELSADEGSSITTTTTYTPVYDKDDPTKVTSYLAESTAVTTSTCVTLKDNDLFGAIQSQREMLTECGEFCSEDDLKEDPAADTKRGYRYYMYSLDLLANQLAEVFNDANNGYVYNENGYYITEEDTNGNVSVINDSTGQPISKNGLTEPQKQDLINQGYYLKDENNNAILDENNNQIPDLDAYLKANKGWKKGCDLFTSSEDGAKIDAGNICISDEWARGSCVECSFEYVTNTNAGIASTDSTNVAYMITLLSDPHDFDPTVIQGKAACDKMFSGSFNDMYINMCAILGNDMSTTTSVLDTHYATAVELNSSRQSVSGVDLNDEAMNLTMYSQAYNAACRLMTTLDSMLDKLVNGTGLT